MDVVERYGMLAARILLVVIFINSGWSKITNFSGSAGYMAQAGMPAVIFMLVMAIIFEVGGSLSILIGYKAKIGAWMLIVFTVLATFYFHLNFAEPMQKVMFMKNLAIIGGLLAIAVHGAGNISLDEGWEK